MGHRKASMTLKTALGLRLGFEHMIDSIDGIIVNTLNGSDRGDRGAAMAEYGLLLGLVALAAMGVLILFGGEIVEVFTEAEETLNTRGDIPPAD